MPTDSSTSMLKLSGAQHTFRPRLARSKAGENFTGFLPAISPEALKAKSDRLRGCGSTGALT